MSRLGLFDVGTFDEAEFDVIGIVSGSYVINDSVEILSLYILPVSETYSYSDIVARQISVSREISEEFNYSDGFTKDWALSREFEEDYSFSLAVNISKELTLTVSAEPYSYSSASDRELTIYKTLSDSFRYTDSAAIVFPTVLTSSDSYSYIETQDEEISDGISTGDTWIWNIKNSENYNVIIENNVAKFTAIWDTSSTSYTETFNHLSLTLQTTNDNEYVAGIIPVMNLTKTNRQAVNVVYHILLD